MLRAITSKARIGGKDINVPAPPKATGFAGDLTNLNAFSVKVS